MRAWPSSLSELFRSAAALMLGWTEVARRRPQPLPPTAPLPARLSLADQWSRVAGVVVEAQARAAHLLDTQRGASAQLDAATYGLQRLREELAPALLFTIPRPTPRPPSPTAFKSDQFRRRDPLAA